MAGVDLSEFGLDRPESGDDVTIPFTLENLDCRGRSVRLGPVLDAILKRHDYPAPVARLLGEAVVLASLMGSSLKFEGKFILQTRTDGPVDMLVVDLDAPDGLRGYARFDAERLVAAAESGKLSAGELLGHGHLAMTVDQGSHTERYQGIVALEGQSLEDVARTYFQQSEQIPTEVRLAVAEHSVKGSKSAVWRAGGLLVQYLPEHEERLFADLPGDGDFENPASNSDRFEESDRWVEARALLATVGDDELVDPDLSPERLLFRLYHETGVRIFDPAPLVERCTCSPERIEDMLQNSFSEADRAEMVVNGEIEVVCEFCSTRYHFNPHHFHNDEN